MNKSISIAGRVIGPDQPPYMIAELSANHLGQIEHAFAIMDAAKQADVDAVKLQTYTADTITLDHDGPGFTIEGGLWNGRRLHELYHEAHTPWEWHEALFARGRELGLAVFSSPFDPTAVDFLESLRTPAYKIASFEIVDLPLIERVAATGKPLIISTGMANLNEIEEAIAAARGAGNNDLVLLHCISGYPTPPEDSNLKRLVVLAKRFDVLVGLSDHTLGTTAAVTATALGAVAVEKHITMLRANGGPDSAFSLEPQEFKALVAECRTAFSALGSGADVRAKSEQANAAFRRSLYVVADIEAGETLTENNIRSIRPGFGLAPKHLKAVIGKRTTRFIARGTPLAWELVEPNE